MLVLIVGDLHLPLRAANLPLKFRKLLVPGKIQQVICTGNVCDRETWDYLRTVAPDVKGVKGDFDESPHLPQTLVLQHGPLRIGVIHGHQILPVGDRDLLGSLAMQMDVDVLLTGATHRFESWEDDGKFFVNPGSATGAWAVDWPLYEDCKEDCDEDRDEDRDEDLKDGVAEHNDIAESKNVAGKDVATGKDVGGKDVTGKDVASVAKKPTRLRPAPPPTPSFVLLDIQGPNIISYVYQLIGGEVKVEKSEFRKNVDGGVVEEGRLEGEGAAATATSSIAVSISTSAW